MHPTVLVLVLAPLALLAIIALFGFVGCNTPTPFTTFRSFALSMSGLVGFWPLDDAWGSTNAADAYGGMAGDYLNNNPNDIQLQAPGIVPGDCKSPNFTQGDFAPSADFEGGYVAIPYSGSFNPPETAAFSIELWAYANWPFTSTGAKRTLISSTDTNFGYEIYATPGNYWEVWTKGGSLSSTVTSTSTLFNGTTTHLVLVYDGTNSDPNARTLKLYVDDQPIGPVSAAAYKPISAQRPLLIGASERSGTVDALFPGRIQDVAFYNFALSDNDVSTLFARGDGRA